MHEDTLRPQKTEQPGRTGKHGRRSRSCMTEGMKVAGHVQEAAGHVQKAAGHVQQRPSGSVQWHGAPAGHALSSGSACSRNQAATACPASWKATVRRSSVLMTYGEPPLGPWVSHCRKRTQYMSASTSTLRC